MRRNKQIILTILITLALLALAWFAGQGRTVTKKVLAVAARCDIPAGCQISADQLTEVEIPAEILSGSYLQDIAAITGQWTTLPVLAGELISSPRLARSAAGLIYPDPGPGRRLLTLELKAADANGFWLAAGNHVDLYLIPRNRESIADLQVLENIRIMAILSGAGQSTGLSQSSSGRDALICLDLNLEQARMINGAVGLYDIRLTAINESAFPAAD
jgi:Flp pilus assembly protein CpaB